MRNNQKGIGHIAIALVISALAVIGVAGWFVYKNQYKKTTNNTTNTINNAETSTQQTVKDDSTKITKVDTTIYDVNISLIKVEDLSKLPSYTPDSFKAYMLDVLKKNTPTVNDEVRVACGYDGKNGDLIAINYIISKISIVNVSGSSAPQNLNTGSGCPGGAPIVWVLNPAGSWDKVNPENGLCKSSGGGLIYEEFTPMCNNEKNPNGSIKSLAQ